MPLLTRFLSHLTPRRACWDTQNQDRVEMVSPHQSPCTSLFSSSLLFAKADVSPLVSTPSDNQSVVGSLSSRLWRWSAAPGTRVGFAQGTALRVHASKLPREFPFGETDSHGRKIPSSRGENQGWLSNQSTRLTANSRGIHGTRPPQPTPSVITHFGSVTILLPKRQLPSTR